MLRFGALVALALTLALPAATQAPADMVTSDAPAFCDHLQHRLAALRQEIPAATQPAEFGPLADSGSQLCASGNTKGGILLLRRALLLIHPLDTTMDMDMGRVFTLYAAPGAPTQIKP